MITFGAAELSLASQRALCSVCGRQATHGTQTLRLAVVCVSQHEKVKQMDQLLNQLDLESPVPEQQPAGFQYASNGAGASNAFWDPAGCCSDTADCGSSCFSSWSICLIFSCWMTHTTARRSV